MTTLVCRDVDTTLASLSCAAGVVQDELQAALRNPAGAAQVAWDEDPWLGVPRRMLATVGRDISTLAFDGAHYFHGSRVADPGVFERRGIRPLGEIIEEIWEALYALVRDHCSAEDWIAFRRDVESGGGGHDGYLYRLKTTDRFHHGPNSCLIRELLLSPGPDLHDYLDCPEIIQDICRCYGDDLEGRFRSATAACIVEYVGPVSSVEHATATACHYLLAKLTGEPLGADVGWGPDNQGVAVPPESVVAVEIVG